MPDDRFQYACHRRLAHARDLRPRQHRVWKHGYQHHQRSHSDEAEDGRRADVGALLGVARIHARALDPNEDEHRHQHGGADLLDNPPESAAVEVALEQIELESEYQDDDEDEDRDDLRYRHDTIDERGLLDAAQDHEVKCPDADRCD